MVRYFDFDNRLMIDEKGILGFSEWYFRFGVSTLDLME